MPNQTLQVGNKLDWFASFSRDANYSKQCSQDEPKTWREGELAVSGLDFVDTGNFLIAGEFWISNAKQLCDKYEFAPLQGLQLVARLWELKQELILSELQGGFAFIVFDQSTRQLKVIRDPIGVRNIYIGREASKFFVASSVSKLRSLVSKEIDPIALRDYLCCSFVPGNQTMFKSIRELRPGEIISLPDYDSRTYWSVQEDYQALEEESLEWHAKRLRATLEEVVSEYLPADEDAGCYLSGGIDSSAIAALARKLHGRDLHCYSIHFGNECPNEIEFSSMVATYCDIKHHIIEISTEQMWQLHKETINLLDDPIGDPLTVPNYILARKAREHTPIILNGEGGDPCFGGPKNQPMMLGSLYSDSTSAKAEQDSAYLASFQKCKSDLPRLLLPKIWNEVKDTPSVFADDLASPGHYVNKLLMINTKYKGADQILSKVNNITTAVGVEGRSPLFDKRIVEASLTIPPQYKLKGAQEKAVLKAAVEDLLPKAILNRPKSGMMVPVQFWFRKYWQSRARKLLLSKNSCIREFLDISLVNDWLDYKNDIWGRYGVKLWLVCALELWLQCNYSNAE